MQKELKELLEKGAVTAARGLIGWHLYAVEPDGTKVGGAITETEAYSQEDAASHSYRGKTPRTEIMFGPAGHVYIYFTYGMHWCMNIVTGETGHGEGVLLRAIEPEAGIEIMRRRRNNRPDYELANGPAKLCQALAVTGADRGVKINDSRFLLEPPIKEYDVLATERIGITKDTHRLWRFVAN